MLFTSSGGMHFGGVFIIIAKKCSADYR
jgi:hypothetical protein